MHVVKIIPKLVSASVKSAELHRCLNTPNEHIAVFLKIRFIQTETEELKNRIKNNLEIFT